MNRLAAPFQALGCPASDSVWFLPASLSSDWMCPLHQGAVVFLIDSDGIGDKLLDNLMQVSRMGKAGIFQSRLTIATMLKLKPQIQHEALQIARTRQATSEFKKQYQQRAGSKEPSPKLL